jgi:hypothetical protein
MSATIYSTPKYIKVPDFDINDRASSRAREDAFMASLRKFCTNSNKGKYIGKEVRIQYADGYARYMVYSLKPLQLIHIPLGDAWDTPLADLLTVKAVKENIDAREALAKIFSKK